MGSGSPVNSATVVNSARLGSYRESTVQLSGTVVNIDTAEWLTVAH